MSRHRHPIVTFFSLRRMQSCTGRCSTASAASGFPTVNPWFLGICSLRTLRLWPRGCA